MSDYLDSEDKNAIHLSDFYTGGQVYQVSVNNECERKILELRNSANDSIFELERRLLTRFLASSCSAIFVMHPSSPSGHYWIRSSNGSAVRVYCEMTRSCGNTSLEDG